MLDILRSVLRFRRFETDPVARRLQRIANISDLRLAAKKRLPAGVFDYIDGGADDEITLRRNTTAFSDITFRPRVLRDVSGGETSTTILGKPAAAPLILAPTGFCRIADPAGELAVSRAAAAAGIPYALSTLATRSLEEIKLAQQSVSPPLGFSAPRRWFQVYVWKDRDLLQELLHRAERSGVDTIVITVDTAVLGRRERDVRRGFTLPPKIGLDTIVQGALHPRWTTRFVTSEPIRFANVTGSAAPDGTDAISLSDHVNSQFDQRLSWDDITWFRDRWSGHIVLKGIQTVADARVAATHGVDAIALSNHGGRQLDGAPAPIDLVRPVAEALGGSIEIFCDGGVRRGSDILKALSLGATACFVGRPYLYGLAVAGERGVEWVIDFLCDGLLQSMALSGIVAPDQATSELIAFGAVDNQRQR
ncbi:alpha-hydroxy acid oxidase [Candidatus Poriferisocius sp.]|uniref:alpha-hydroxy acid oxidase n=1 Tax=Candidatus Poriferisocius sp. TaxID=3101276 RepID=UPI003B024E4E